MAAMDANASTNKLFEKGRRLLEQGRGEEALRYLSLAHTQAPQHLLLMKLPGFGQILGEREQGQ